MDGLMDTCDALGSRGDREKKLAILKDSHTGAFAVLSCVIYIGLYIGLGTAVKLDGRTFALIGAGLVLERGLSGLAVTVFPCARDSGLLYAFADSAARKTVRIILLILSGTMVAIMLTVMPLYGGGMVAAAALSFLYYYCMSRRQFGGITGDLAGYFLQICEVAMLGALVLVQRITEVV